jgi:hypothetical protein
MSKVGCQVALQGPIPVEFGQVFPDGVYAAGGFEPVRDFDACGLPLWVVEVIDADATARTRTVKVKVAAQVQPVLPAHAGGVPFVPVEFTGLTVTPYVMQAGKLGYSLKASGVRSPSPGGRTAGRPGAESGREAAA